MGVGDLLSVSEAAALVHVSTEQVRRYVRAGLLPAKKTAGVWLVPTNHVQMLVERRPGGGRPLSCSAAWRDILASSIRAAEPYRYRNRATVTRWSSGHTQVQRVLRHPDIVIGGIHAAAVHGALVVPLPDEAQIYVSRSAASRDPVHERPWSGLTPDPTGEVVARVVPDHLWPRLLAECVTAPSGRAAPVDGGRGARYAPASLAVLDLATSPHPRERAASADVRSSRRN